MKRKSLLSVQNVPENDQKKVKPKPQFRGTLLTPSQASPSPIAKPLKRPKIFLGVARSVQPPSPKDSPKKAENEENEEIVHEEIQSPVAKKPKRRRLNQPSIPPPEAVKTAVDVPTPAITSNDAPTPNHIVKKPLKRRKPVKTTKEITPNITMVPRPVKKQPTDRRPRFIGDNWVPPIAQRSIPTVSQITARLKRHRTPEEVISCGLLFPPAVIDCFFPFPKPQFAHAESLWKIDADIATRVAKRLKNEHEESISFMIGSTSETTRHENAFDMLEFSESDDDSDTHESGEGGQKFGIKEVMNVLDMV